MDQFDRAQQVEERDRELCIAQRKPTGPPACGYCYHCGEQLRDAHRWCGSECRDDWERGNRGSE